MKNKNSFEFATNSEEILKINAKEDFPTEKEVTIFFDNLSLNKEIPKEVLDKFCFYLIFQKSGIWNYCYVNEYIKYFLEIKPVLALVNNSWKQWILDNIETDLAQLMMYTGTLIRLHNYDSKQDKKICSENWVSWFSDITELTYIDEKMIVLLTSTSLYKDYDSDFGLNIDALIKYMLKNEIWSEKYDSFSFYYEGEVLFKIDEDELVSLVADFYKN